MRYLIGVMSKFYWKKELDPIIVKDPFLLPEEVLTHQSLWMDPITLVYSLTTIDHQNILAQGVVIEYQLIWSEVLRWRN